MVVAILRQKGTVVRRSITAASSAKEFSRGPCMIYNPSRRAAQTADKLCYRAVKRETELRRSSVDKVILSSKAIKIWAYIWLHQTPSSAGLIQICNCLSLGVPDILCRRPCRHNYIHTLWPLVKPIYLLIGPRRNYTHHSWFKLTTLPVRVLILTERMPRSIGRHRILPSAQWNFLKPSQVYLHILEDGKALLIFWAKQVPWAKEDLSTKRIVDWHPLHHFQASSPKYRLRMWKMTLTMMRRTHRWGRKWTKIWPMATIKKRRLRFERKRGNRSDLGWLISKTSQLFVWAYNFLCRLTHSQTRFLQSEFSRQAHPDAAQRTRLSKEIPGLSPRQVQVWFQNR